MKYKTLLALTLGMFALVSGTAKAEDYSEQWQINKSGLGFAGSKTSELTAYLSVGKFEEREGYYAAQVFLIDFAKECLPNTDSSAIFTVNGTPVQFHVICNNQGYTAYHGKSAKGQTHLIMQFAEKASVAVGEDTITAIRFREVYRLLQIQADMAL